MPTTATVTAQQREEIKEIVCDILEIEAAEVTDTSLFKEEHNADSLGAIEILSALERTFGIEIDQAELVRMVNMNGVVDVVQEVMAE